MTGDADAAAGELAARRAELSRNLLALRTRIAAACEEAGRPADAVTLIAITKTFPASDVRLLARLGITEVGENRDQEAAPKAAQCADLPVRWHFVGQLQVNKCASVVRYADVVHSVDRPRLVTALGRRARAAGRTVTCLVQVDLDPAATAGQDLDGPNPGGPRPGRADPGGGGPLDPGGPAQGAPDHGEAHRGGALPADVLDLAGAIAAEGGLELGGVMAVAPLGLAARPAFRQLAGIAAEVRSAHPGAIMISAGMTGDLEDAIAEGATHVRVGTALLGGRRAFVR